MNHQRLWAVSLSVIGIDALFLLVSRIAGVSLPDTAVRVLGAVLLAAIPVFVFATVRKQTKER